MITEEQIEKAKTFHRLHQNGLLLLPNIWDALGASLVEHMGFPAVATASASVAWSNGYKDAEQIPFYVALSQIKSIVNATSLPVTADIESGYSNSLPALKEKIRMLMDAGIVGINIEDFDHRNKKFFSIEEQCERLQLIKDVTKESGVPLFINARCDVFTKTNDESEKKLEAFLQRGKAYLQSGAECIFALAVKEKEALQTIVQELNCPVNVLFFPGVPDLSTLQQVGVRRVSFGPNLLKIAIAAMKNFMQQLKEGKGLEIIENNEVTSDFVSGLIGKNV
jgi:2-methylisocitrate lyase-like PEP mutase family enzyme